MSEVNCPKMIIYRSDGTVHKEQEIKECGCDCPYYYEYSVWDELDDYYCNEDPDVERKLNEPVGVKFPKFCPLMKEDLCQK